MKIKRPNVTLFKRKEKNVNYDKLYLRIIKIGIGRAHRGLSYAALNKQLAEEGYNMKNGCIQKAVKAWFFGSFHHTGKDTNPCTELAHLDNHLGCSFVLKGEACLSLLDYNNSNRSMWAGYLGLIVAVIAIGLQVFGEPKLPNQSQRQQENIELGLQQKGQTILPLPNTQFPTDTAPNVLKTLKSNVDTSGG